MSNAPSKPVSFSRPKVGYFSNRPRIVGQVALVGVFQLKLPYNSLYTGAGGTSRCVPTNVALQFVVYWGR